MNRKLIYLIFMFTILASLYAQKANIAVLQFDAAGITEAEVRILTDRLRSELYKTDAFNVIERSVMDEVLKEQGFQQSGCVTAECAVEVGKLVGVDQMVTGTIGKIGSIYTITARMIDVETGSTVGQASEDCTCPIEILLTETMARVASDLSGIPVKPRIAEPVVPLTGSVSFSSVQDNVTIIQDGKIRLTPFDSGEMNEGIYQYEASKAGFVPFSGEFEITAGKTTLVTVAALKPRTGSVTFSSVQDNVTITQDGTVGLTPFLISDKDLGIYQFEATKDGFIPFSGEFEITAGKTTLVTVAALKPSTGSVSFSSVQDSITISQDGTVELTPLVISDKDVGRYQFEATKDGFVPFSGEFEITAGKTTLVTVAALNPRLGMLSINTNPEGAEVFLDGISRGYSPLDIDNLTLGIHDIRTSKAGYRPVVKNVTLEDELEGLLIYLELKVGSLNVVTSRPAQKFDLIVGEKTFTGISSRSIDLPEGTYEVVIKEYGYKDFIDSVFIQDRQAFRLKADNKPIMVPVTFSLNPEHASVFTNGKVLPNPVNNDFVYGDYNLLAKAPKHKSAKFSLNINTPDPITKEINLIPKSRKTAIIYSTLLPGTGQFYADNNGKAFFFMVAAFGSAAILTNTFQIYNTENDLMQEYRVEYQSATSMHDINQTWTRYDDQVGKVNDIQTQLMIYGGLLGVSWFSNLIDTFFFSGLEGD